MQKNHKKVRKDFIKSNIYIEANFGGTNKKYDKLTSNDGIICIKKFIKRR